MKRNGQPRIIVTDNLCFYRAVMMIIGNADWQKIGRLVNNRAENSYLPLRLQKRAILRFRRVQNFQKSVLIQNHFNQEHHLYLRTNFKLTRYTTLAE